MNICGISSYQTSFSGKLVPKSQFTGPKLSKNVIAIVKAAKYELANVERDISKLEDEISMNKTICTKRYMECLKQRLDAARTLEKILLDTIKNPKETTEYYSDVLKPVILYKNEVKGIEESFDMASVQPPAVTRVYIPAVMPKDPVI